MLRRNAGPAASAAAPVAASGVHCLSEELVRVDEGSPAAGVEPAAAVAAEEAGADVGVGVLVHVRSCP